MREEKGNQGVAASSGGHSGGLRPEPVPVSAVPAPAVNAWTPGPWRTACEGDSEHRTLVSANTFGEAGEKNGGIYVAVAQGPDNLPNARLIAAAPDLAEALAELEARVADYRMKHDLKGDGSPEAGRAWDLMKRAQATARAALAKARGE